MDEEPNERCAATHPQKPYVHCARDTGHEGRHCNAIGKSQYGDDFLWGSLIWDDQTHASMW